MTIQEVIDRVLAYHPQIDRPNTVDCIKYGDPSREVTGIVTTCYANIGVIRKAHELGANFIICHEPVFYTNEDENSWLEGKNEVYEEKKKLLDEYGITIWRDHDHIHAHRPDHILFGIMMELGWQDYLIGDPDRPLFFHLPPMTVRELAVQIKEKMDLNGLRLIGNPDAVIRNVKIGGHIFCESDSNRATTEMFAADDVDVLIPGEVIDWTTLNYANDAGLLGKRKAILNVGHFNYEGLGMKYAAHWIGDLIDHAVPVLAVPSGDIYQFIV